MRMVVKVNRSNSTEEIIEFISQSLSIPLNKITKTASLFHDLGIDGDDAIDFLNEFSHTFGVSLSQFRFNEYFGPEGSATPWGFIKEIVTKSSFTQKKRLEVKDLIQAVSTGKLP